MSELAKKKPADLKALINQENVREQFRRALPKHLYPERFVRVATTALTRIPKLRECTKESFMRCLMDLSAMGLEPDGRYAHLIPFRNKKLGVTECTLIVDYKGIADMVRRSGEVSHIHCDVVCENDAFSENLGQIEVHRINRKRPRGEMYAAYSRVTLKDGTVSCCVMSKDEIDSIRGRSKSGDNGPWVTDYNEMAKKTVFRRHSKLLPLSSELFENLAKDDEYQFREMRDVTPPAEPDNNPLIMREDVSAVEQEQPAETEPEPAKKKPAKDPAEGLPKVSAYVEEVEEFTGPLDDTTGQPKWVRYDVELKVADEDALRKVSTFSRTIGDTCEWNKGGKALVAIEPAKNPKHTDTLVFVKFGDEEGGAE